MSLRHEAKMRIVPWWLILIEGIILLILGYFFLTSPGMTTLAVATFVAIYWMISGIFGLISLLWNRHNWFWKILMGILGIVAGWLILSNPISGTAALGGAFVLYLGIMGIILGIVNLIRAFTGEGWGVGILGVISAILGVLLLANFWGVVFSLPWALGILALIGGAVAIFNAIFRARPAQHEMEANKEALAEASATRSATTSAAAGTAAVGAAAAGAVAATQDKADDVPAAAAAVADAAGDAADATADAVGDAAGATVDAAGDAAAAAAAAVGVSRWDGLDESDQEAIMRWAKDKNITRADIDKFMDSPYADLLAKGMTPAERRALAAELGVDPKKVLEWLNRLDLERIKGVGPVYANLLEVAGVDTVKELAQRNPANLQAKLEEVNAVQNLTDRVPTEAELTDWIAQAKALPRALEY